MYTKQSFIFISTKNGDPKEESKMSLHIQIIYEKELDWVNLHLSGNSIRDIRQTGYWLNKKVTEMKYPDGRIWLFETNKWDLRAVKEGMN